MKVTFWGTRGSIPVSGPGFIEHGGATTCLQLEAPGHDPIIIDCGSGLAEMGRALGFGLTRARFYQTHMHWDHVQGFPFFASLFNPGARFELFATPREGQTLEQTLSAQMTRPTFPVGLDIVPAALDFHALPTRGEHHFGQVRVRWTEVWHPSGSTAYRFDHAGASLVFSGDVEVAQGSCRADLIELAAGADTLVMDAQYFPDEYAQRVGFGHSTPIDAVEVALAAGVRQLILTHHDPCHHDDALERKLAMARAHAPASLEVTSAFDGRVHHVTPAPATHRAVA